MADTHFNGLTPSQVERLDMLAEEAAEIIVAVSKIKRHGRWSYNPDKPQDGNNVEQLNRELADLNGVLVGMSAAGDPFMRPTIHQERAAWEKKLRYAHHQQPEAPHA